MNHRTRTKSRLLLFIFRALCILSITLGIYTCVIANSKEGLLGVDDGRYGTGRRRRPLPGGSELHRSLEEVTIHSRDEETIKTSLHLHKSKPLKTKVDDENKDEEKDTPSSSSSIIATPMITEKVEDREESLTRPKPKLFLHVGPLKTGSTAIQMNVIQDPHFGVLLTADNFQTIDFSYLRFGKLARDCLQKGPGKCDYKTWDDLNATYVEAYRKATATPSLNPIHTLHSLEDWSNVPKSNFTFSLMEELLEPWDVHVIIFNRPFIDWLPSMYSQYRKFFLVKPRHRLDPFKQKYLVGRYEQMLFPQFFQKMLNDNSLRDTLGTYEFYEDFLAYLRQKGGVQNIHIMQFDAQNGIEREFLCKLPGSKKSCQHITGLSKYKGTVRNKVNSLPLNSDLIIVEAWNQNLVSIRRNDAAVALEERMKESKITMTDLPLVCLSDKQEEWVWNRTLISERMFGTGSTTESDLRERLEDALKKKKYCSVNATAALEIKTLRALFDNCIFQSPNLITRAQDKGIQGESNPKWTDLGCDAAVRADIDDTSVQ